MPAPDPLARITEAVEKATPLSHKTRLFRYDHGGGRWFLDGKAGERHLIADFYNEGDREAFVALRENADALLACAALLAECRDGTVSKERIDAALGRLA